MSFARLRKCRFVRSFAQVAQGALVRSLVRCAWCAYRSFVGHASVDRSLGGCAAIARSFKFAQVAQTCLSFCNFQFFELTRSRSEKGANLARQVKMARQCVAKMDCLAKFRGSGSTKVSTRKVQKLETQNTFAQRCAKSSIDLWCSKPCAHIVRARGARVAFGALAMARRYLDLSILTVAQHV